MTDIERLKSEQLSKPELRFAYGWLTAACRQAVQDLRRLRTKRDSLSDDYWLNWERDIIDRLESDAANAGHAARKTLKEG